LPIVWEGGGLGNKNCWGTLPGIKSKRLLCQLCISITDCNI
jgi:hypothetical protein